MGKYTPREYMRFTHGHCKHLLKDYAIRACDDLHSILEEWGLQGYEDADPAVWSFRASVTYRLRDMQSSKRKNGHEGEERRRQHNIDRRYSDIDAAQRTFEQKRRGNDNNRIATEAMRRVRERNAKETNSPAPGGQGQLRDTAAGVEEWRPGAGQRSAEGG